MQARLGRDTHPSGRHDGTGSYEFAAHSDLFEMMSSDVNAPLVLKAIRNFEALPVDARSEEGYESYWFWFFITRKHDDMIVYTGI